MKLEGKVIAVTGGGNGIGRELVLQSLRRGAEVAAIDIRGQSLDEVAELAGAGGRLATIVGDVTDRAAVASLPAKVIESFGVVDGLIHNAGIIQPFVTLEELDYEAIERVINVNLWGTIHMVKAFIPLLLTRPEGHIANVSSMGAFLPVPGQTVYGATKAAVKLLTEGLYAELLDTNVGVSVVMPGAVMTEITENSGVETPDVGDTEFEGTSPQEAARIILDGIEDDQFHIYVGKDSLTMNLLNRAAPRFSTHLIQKRMKSLLG